MLERKQRVPHHDQTLHLSRIFKGEEPNPHSDFTSQRHDLYYRKIKNGCVADEKNLPKCIEIKY
jgi:hypothetical protein